VGVLLVVAGTSGAGKGTVVRKLLDREPNLWYSVSMTTRPRREGEVPGRDYEFVSPEDFERTRDAGGFLETFEVYGHHYGTPRAAVDQHLAAGRDVVLEIDVQGAMAVREQFPGALLVFVRAPSREEQRRRLRERGQDDPATIERRLREAEAEEALADRFDEVVVNDDVDRATEQVAAILQARQEAERPGDARAQDARAAEHTAHEGPQQDPYKEE
jgi:guanylate kinase